MSRADVEQFLAQAEDVLTDWDGSPDAATWNPQVEQDDSDPGPLDYYLQDRPNTFWAGPPRHRMTGEDALAVAVARAFDVPPEILAMRPIGYVRDRSEQPPPAMIPLRLQQMPQAQVNLYTMTAEQCRDVAMDYIRTHYGSPGLMYAGWRNRPHSQQYPSLPFCVVHGCRYELHIDQRNGDEPGRCEVHVRTRVVCPAGHVAVPGNAHITFDGASCVPASNEVDSVACATADGTTPNPTDCGSEAADGGTT